MVQILPQRDIGGQIGQAFGSALSEQLGENFKNRRLSNAFKKFQEGGTNGNYDISELIKTPGALEALPHFMPYLKEISGRKGIQKAAQGVVSSPGVSLSTEGGLPGPSNVKEFENIKPKAGGKIFLPTEEIAEKAKNIKTSPEPEDYYQRAEQLRQNFPYANKDELLAQAQKDIDATFAAQEANVTKGKNLLKEMVSTALQQNGLQDYSKLEGDLLEKLNSQVSNDIAVDKLSPENAVNRYKESLLNISRTLANLRNSSLSGKSAESNIKTTYDEFKKLGLENRFPVYASEIFKLPAMSISQIVEPVENKEFKKLIPTFARIQKINYDKLAESITPEDNIASMMDYLDDKGGDVGEFREAIRTKKEGKLTRNQEIQLQNLPPTRSDKLDKEFFRYSTR